MSKHPKNPNQFATVILMVVVAINLWGNNFNWKSLSFKGFTQNNEVLPFHRLFSTNDESTLGPAYNE